MNGEPSTLDPARLAAVAVLSAAGVSLDSGLDLDKASEVMRREMEIASLRGRTAGGIGLTWVPVPLDPPPDGPTLAAIDSGD